MVLLLCLSAVAAAQSLRVVEIRVEGKAVNDVVEVVQFVPPQRAPNPLLLQVGQTLADGAEVGIPARTVVVLQTANGNRIELAPDSRFSASRVGANGETHNLLGGNARFDVRRALSFFNVDFNRFVALVRGTQFEVTAGGGGEGALEVKVGRVGVQREVPTVMQDTGGHVDMLAHDTLDAQSNPRQQWPAVEPVRRYTHSNEALAQYAADLKQAEQSKDRDAQYAALNNMGLTWLARGVPREAQAYFQRMLTMAQGSQDEPWRARALNNLGAAALEQGAVKAAVKYLEAALALNQTLAPNTAQRRVAQVEGNLGLAWRRLGDAAKARDYTERSLRVHQQLAEGRDSAAVARNFEALGNLEKDATAAEQWHRRALQMRERLYGDGAHPEVASSYLNLGLLATRANDDRAAAEFYGRAVAVWEKIQQNQIHTNFAAALTRHGSALCRSGDIDAGVAQQVRALNMRLALSRGPVDPTVVESYQQIAACWAIAAGQGQAGAKERMLETLQRMKDYQASGAPKSRGTY